VRFDSAEVIDDVRNRRFQVRYQLRLFDVFRFHILELFVHVRSCEWQWNLSTCYATARLATLSKVRVSCHAVTRLLLSPCHVSICVMSHCHVPVRQEQERIQGEAIAPPPKTCESNFIHHDFVKIRRTTLRPLCVHYFVQAVLRNILHLFDSSEPAMGLD